MRLLEKPIIQGGMGVGISRSSLAGAVAKEGGMGVISAAQIGYDMPFFFQDPETANLQALSAEIKKAKQISENKGAIAVNLMTVTQLYSEYVKTAVEAGVDAIISGAGLPLKLPEYVKNSDVKIAPIVSSRKAAEVILKMCDKKYQRTADFIVMEGPSAGGHLGFSEETLEDLSLAEQGFAEEVKTTIQLKNQYEEKYKTHIPLFVAGGISTREDVLRAFSLGADGVQVASRFVATKECDASAAYKQAYIDAKEEDLMIIESPVGMPGRAIRNPFVERMQRESEKITFCYNCLKACNPAEAKYCISQALIDAVKGDVENGLLFAGACVGQIHQIQTVKEVIDELLGEEK